MSNEPLVSCLCVTENRPAFLPWLLWNYGKQDHPARELVVVDSSQEPPPLPGRPDLTVVHCRPGTSVARKRNLAVEAARGAALTWFDDDDWQHPRKLSILARALGGDAAVAGSARSWFVDIQRLRARSHTFDRGVLFNGLAVRREVLDGVRFDERRSRAADTGWMTALHRRTGRPPVKVADVLFLWLCHRDNISNPASRYVFSQSLDTVRGALGAPAWGDTDEQLEALRGRLAAA